MSKSNKTKVKNSFDQTAYSGEGSSDLKIECFLDECVTGLAATNAFPEDVKITTIQSIGLKGYDDSNIVNHLTFKSSKGLFVTADTKDTFYFSGSKQLTLIRFTSNNSGSDFQANLLRRLQLTKGFRDIQGWLLEEEIRLSPDVVRYKRWGGIWRERKLFTPCNDRQRRHRE